MTPQELWELARPRLEQLVDHSLLGVSFVDDGLVDYGMPERIYVRRSSLFELTDVPRWSALLVDTPSWIHLNLIQSEAQDSVVSLRRSANRSISNHSLVNVSAERKPLTIEDG